MISDYHIHTKLCHHAKGEMEDYVRQGLSVGLKTIGFSDHAPNDDGFDPHHRMTTAQFPEYVHAVESLREKYPDIEIKLGIEADIYPGFEFSLKKIISNYPIDYVIGSVHFIDGISIFNDGNIRFSMQEKSHLIHRYFELLELGVASNLIDIVGHLDVVRLIVPEKTEEIFMVGTTFLTRIEEEDLVIEINTSGLRKTLQEVYPVQKFILLAHRLQIPLCFGSDAHRPDQVGSGFMYASRLLSEIGYSPVISRQKSLEVYRI